MSPHLTRLGFRDLPLKNAVWDEDTHMFLDLFRAAIAKINIDVGEIERLLSDAKLLLEKRGSWAGYLR